MTEIQNPKALGLPTSCHGIITAESWAALRYNRVESVMDIVPLLNLLASHFCVISETQQNGPRLNHPQNSKQLAFDLNFRAASSIFLPSRRINYKNDHKNDRAKRHPQFVIRHSSFVNSHAPAVRVGVYDASGSALEAIAYIYLQAMKMEMQGQNLIGCDLFFHNFLG